MKRVVCLFMIVCLTSVAMSHEKMNDMSTPLHVLVFSKTSGFRHHSITNGVKAMSELAQENNWDLITTENSDLFTPKFLRHFDVIVFLNSTGDVLNANQQKAFFSFMNAGKGFVGIHAAADCEHDWPWYGELNGAYFRNHPPVQKGTVVIEDLDHPAMAVFAGMKTYIAFDEWYSFENNPRGKVHVLASLDETSILRANNDDWKMGDHPLIWWQEQNGIRSFYTVFGHTPESFDDPKILKHIADAIEWAGKRR